MYNWVITETSASRVKKERIYHKALQLWANTNCKFMDMYEDVYVAETHNLANSNFGFNK